MDKQNIDELVKVLSEIINNRYKPISPKEMKTYYGIDKSSQTSTEYNRRKTNLQRILDFYNQTKIITYVTDTVDNEIKQLKSRKDMENLKPYILLLSQKSVESLNQRKKEIKSVKNDEDKVYELELKNICDKYSKVEKVKSTNLIYVNPKGKKINESLLPNNYDNLKTDKDGYRVVNIDGKNIKVKSKYVDSTSYELCGQKFEYIDVNFNSETIEYETKQFTNESGKFIQKTICLEDEIDLDNKEVSPYDIMYRLFLECDFRDEYNNINSPIEFQIPQKDTHTFVEFFVSMVDKFDYDIKSKPLIKLSQSDMFQNKSDEVKLFITNTYTKLMIKMTEYEKDDKPYPFQFLLDLIDTKLKLNIRLNIDDEEVELSKTSIKKLIVKENGLDIKLSHSLMNLSNINQITLIQSYDTPLTQSDDEKIETKKQFYIDIEKLRNILSEIDNENSKEMIEFIDSFKRVEDIFTF